jgi:glycosyltransferase involved in cell wall biosynthesis
MTTVHSALDGRIFHRQCRSLARAGFRVTSIGPYPADGVVDEVNVKSIRKERSRLARMSLTVWRAYCAAMRIDADIYHFHDPELIPVGLLLRAHGKHVIYDLHEDYPKDILSKGYLPAWSRGAISWAMDRLERAACGRFSAVVAVTPSIAERFRRINRRTVIVHNYPYPDEVIPQDAGSSWNSRRQSVVYVGGITRNRGIREMVEAIGLLPASLHAELELAGPLVAQDIELAELQKLPGWKRVKYHGLLELFTTFQLLQQARVGLVLFYPEPNHIEAMPQKMFEYMGAGIPVIASDFQFWRRLIGSVGCALFVDPADPRAVADAIRELLTHPEKSMEMGLRGQAEVRSRFNWENEAHKLIRLYDGLAATKCVA